MHTSFDLKHETLHQGHPRFQGERLCEEATGRTYRIDRRQEGGAEWTLWMTWDLGSPFPRTEMATDNKPSQMKRKNIFRLLLNSFFLSFLFLPFEIKIRSQEEPRKQPHTTSQQVSDIMRQGHLHLQRAMVYQFS